MVACVVVCVFCAVGGRMGWVNACVCVCVCVCVAVICECVYIICE